MCRAPYMGIFQGMCVFSSWHAYTEHLIMVSVLFLTFAYARVSICRIQCLESNYSKARNIIEAAMQSYFILILQSDSLAQDF